jgi:signal transduction histidine kinase
VGVRAWTSDPATVYVATSLKLADGTTVLVRSSLLVGAPLLLALVAAMTWMAVGRSLRPVEAIRSEVADISSSDLTRRVPVPAGNDEIGLLAGTMNAMLDRLQSAAERQRRFVADASHELQSPLAAVRTDLEVALAHPQQTRWPDAARRLLEQNIRMQRLVSDLLFVARSDGNPARSHPRPVDLHEVVLDETTQLACGTAVRVDTSAVRPAFVLGRRDDLARAVRNLLDNAARHATCTVRVALGCEDGVVRLVVADDGPGVRPEDRDRIFERFTRLDHARHRSTGGTGLGLAIVHDIVAQHHGSVAVQDSDVGARFVLTLPAD